MILKKSNSEKPKELALLEFKSKQNTNQTPLKCSHNITQDAYGTGMKKIEVCITCGSRMVVDAVKK